MQESTLVSSVRHLRARLDSSPPCALAELAQETAELLSQANDTFTDEEQEDGGYMSEVLAERPAFRRRACALAAQHDQFRAHLLLAIEQLSAGGPIARATGDQLGELLDELEAHQEAEREVWTSAFTIDLGAGD